MVSDDGTRIWFRSTMKLFHMCIQAQQEVVRALRRWTIKSIVLGGHLAQVPSRTPIGARTRPASDNPRGGVSTMRKLCGR